MLSPAWCWRSTRRSPCGFSDEGCVPMPPLLKKASARNLDHQHPRTQHDRDDARTSPASDPIEAGSDALEYERASADECRAEAGGADRPHISLPSVLPDGPRAGLEYNRRDDHDEANENDLGLHSKTGCSGMSTRLVTVTAPTGPISASPARVGRRANERIRGRLIEIATTTRPVSVARAASSAEKKWPIRARAASAKLMARVRS